MTQNRRIALNVVATYGRSLYALILGLFSGRWLLMSLGQVDYGLFGMIGGLVFFISFLDNLLADAVGRFYAYSVGAAKKAVNAQAALEDCRQWFNTALLIHAVIPIVLLAVGYPVGEYAVRHFLTIPVNRLDACVWVWRFVCINCLVSMLAVPFSAMYTAKQEIAELTVYSFITSTLNVLILWYMVNHPSDWLITYSFLSVAIAILPKVIICYRAVLVYPECRIRMKYLWNPSRIYSLFNYAGCRFVGGVSILAGTQGLSIVVNKYIGPIGNATMTIGNSVSGHVMSLATALSGAFGPAITNAAGADELDMMKTLSYKTCRFGSLLALLFVIPLCLEIKYVIVLWLKTPPPYAAGLCVCVLIAAVLEQMTIGLPKAIMALGHIATYSFMVGWTGVALLLCGWGALACGFGIVSIGVAIILVKCMTVSVRLVCAKRQCGMEVSTWIKGAFMPSLLVSILSCAVSLPLRLLMGESLLRLGVSTILSVTAFLFLSWKFALLHSERASIVREVTKRFGFSIQ